MAFDILEGCIWFAIATAAELPQVVSLASFIAHMFWNYKLPTAAKAIIPLSNMNSRGLSTGGLHTLQPSASIPDRSQ